MRKKHIFVITGLMITGLMLASCGANKKLLKENQDLSSNLEATRNKVAELEGLIGEKDREIQDLQARIEAREEELLALQGELAESEAETRDLEARIVSRQEEIDSLRGSAKTRGEEHSKDLASLKRDFEAAKRKGEQLESAIAELKNSIGDQSEDLRGLRAERDALQSRINEINAEKDVVAQRNTVLEKEIASLRTETETDREKMESTYEGLLASLREEVDQKTVEIQRYRNALTINIMNHIFFDSGKADIKKDGFSVLDRIASIVKELPEKVVKIEGHTDDVPIGARLKAKYPTNWELGAARASAVARYFTGTHKIDPSRIVTVSYAFYRPLVPNTSAENRAKNRRIEIVLTDRELYQLMEVERDPAIE
jgi:chemotaxis protein MotB